jgi:hypothetical protein
MAEQINSANEVIDRLGGNTVLAGLLDPPVTPNAVGNWRERGFPPETFIAITSLLNARNLYAPLTLWRRMREVANGE